MKKLNRWSKYAMLASFFALALNAIIGINVFAGSGDDCAVLKTACNGNLTSIFGDIESVLRTAVPIAGGISIMICGVMWATALDNESRVATAKKRLIETCIGLLVFGLWGVINEYFFGGTKAQTMYGEINDSTDLAGILGSVITNITSLANDVARVLKYVGLAGIVYGGYLYASSAGESGKAAKGKKAVVNSVIGTLICNGVNIVGNYLWVILRAGNNATSVDGIIDVTLDIATEVSWWVGSFCAVMIVYGAILIAGSAGDSSKVNKGKTSILYSCIGLAISIAALAILTYVSGKFGISL